METLSKISIVFALLQKTKKLVTFHIVAKKKVKDLAFLHEKNNMDGVKETIKQYFRKRFENDLPELCRIKKTNPYSLAAHIEDLFRRRFDPYQIETTKREIIQKVDQDPAFNLAEKQKYRDFINFEFQNPNNLKHRYDLEIRLYLEKNC